MTAFNLADEKKFESIEAHLVVWLVNCMTKGPFDTVQKSQLIDKAAEQYMKVIDSASPPI